MRAIKKTGDDDQKATRNYIQRQEKTKREKEEARVPAFSLRKEISDLKRENIKRCGIDSVFLSFAFSAGVVRKPAILRQKDVYEIGRAARALVLLATTITIHVHTHSNNIVFL